MRKMTNWYQEGDAAAAEIFSKAFFVFPQDKIFKRHLNVFSSSRALV